MKSRSLSRTLRGRNAFSLIEVMLAIGIISFAFVSVMGLLVVALKNERQASDDTAMASMTQYISSTLRARSFTATTSAPTFFAFDIDGRCLVSSATPSPSLPTGTFFTCSVTNLSVKTGTVRLYGLPFIWPTPANVSTNLVTMTVATGD